MRRCRPPRQVCGFLLWVSLALPFGTALRPFGGEPAEASLPTLTQVEQILQLSLEEARKQYPVRIEASVTLNDDNFKLLFVQDATAGVFVNGLSPPLTLAAGQRLAIQGVTGPGLLSPIVDRALGELIAPGALPEPWRIGIGELIMVNPALQPWKTLAGHARPDGIDYCRALYDSLPPSPMPDIKAVINRDDELLQPIGPAGCTSSSLSAEVTRRPTSKPRLCR